MLKKLLLTILLPLAVAPVLAQGDAKPVFEAGNCPFVVPAGYSADCGWLTVPEDRSDPDSPAIRLAVASFRSTAADPAPDPVVYLAGGPGENPLETIPYNFEVIFAPFLAYGDFIMVDQRGTGFSEPALDCPEIVGFALETLDDDLETEVALAQLNDVIRACHDRLVAEGANLAAYNSAANAADLNDLRLALGYDEWNLYGVSYGTRLAQTIMRDHPEGLRSVVLDSVYPIEVDLYASVPQNLRRALDVFFAGCAADPDCNAAYPDLETVFFDTVARLNADPAVFEVLHPLQGTLYDLLMNGDTFSAFLFEMLYKTPVFPVLPQTIYEAAGGNYGTVAMLYSSQMLGLEMVSPGMQFSAQCHEEIPFGSREAVEAAAAAYPELEEMIEATGTIGANIFTICDFWGAGEAAPVENEPVTGDIPTLILSGEYDPITPPAWGELLHTHLSASYFYTFPGTGHGVAISGHDCPLEMTLVFLHDPATAPDAACIEAMTGPDFAVPDDAPTIALAEITLDAFGFSSLVPEGWQEVGPGVFARGSTAIDQAALIQQAAPMSASSLVNLIATQFGLSQPPELVETVDYGGFTWDLYQAEIIGLVLDVALAEQNGRTYVVVLVAAANERDALYEQVMVPVLAAITPTE